MELEGWIMTENLTEEYISTTSAVIITTKLSQTGCMLHSPSFEFDNIMQITIEHLLGWDQSKNQNKPNHGIFGNLDGYIYAIEEQGQKTLHAHVLLWIQEWNDLYKQISSDEFRNQAKEELKQYANKVMSSTIIGNKNHVKDMCVNSDCRKDQASNIEKVSLQDVRCLRFKKANQVLVANP
jgi:hypothetical protein